MRSVPALAVRVVLRSIPVAILLAGAGGAAAADGALSPAGGADLAVVAADAADPALVDRDLVYRVTVSNLGPQPAERVTLTISIAGQAQLAARPSPSGGSCLGQTTQIRCSLKTIRSKRRAVVIVRVHASDLGTVQVSAVVTSRPETPSAPITARCRAPVWSGCTACRDEVSDRLGEMRAVPS